MDSSLVFVLLVAVFSTISASFQNLPEWRNGPSKHDDMIFIRGKHFHRNGSSLVAALAQTNAQIYKQCMDHFKDPSCSQKWNQRYWVNKNYYQSGGPVFFMLGAEGPGDGFVDGGQWLWYAQKYGAVLVVLEHRFYGQSIPTTQCWSINFDDQTQKEQFFRWMAMQMWASNYPKTEDMSKCGTLDGQNGADVLRNYGNFLTAMGQGQCSTGQSNSKAKVSSYQDEVREFIHSKEGVSSGAAGWYWQTCYEFGYYQTADPTYQVFGTDFTPLTYVQECQAEYGSTFTSQYIQSRINQTNAYYKGKQNDGTCIIFVNGQYDPWHSLGINDPSETSASNSVVSIATGEHCEDMGHSQKQDTVAAQAKIQDQIGKYLVNPNCV